MQQQLAKELSDKEVLRIAGPGTKFMVYTQLYEYDNLDDVFGAYNKIILLYIHDNDGNNINGHYCALINHPNRIEFFDSYSLMPDQLLYKYKSRKEREKTNQPRNYLTTLLYTYLTKPIEYNEYAYQKMSSRINTCGRWVGIRLRFSSLSLTEFQKVMNAFKRMGCNMDVLITDFSNRYLRKKSAPLLY